MKENREEEIESLWKRVSYLISKARQPQEIILGIAKEAKDLLRADAASVRLLEDENLILVGGYGLSEEYKTKIPLKMGEGLVGKVAKLRKPLISEDIEKDPQILYPEVDRKEGIVSLICVPILAEGRLFGTFTIYSKNKRSWDKKEAEVLSLLSEQLALSLERIKDLQTLREKSIQDELSGLYSRSYLLARAKEELARASREKGSVSFLFCDIDNFKAVNRTQGYKEGDKVLCKMANIIKSSVRKEDVVCRYGGDEFVVLLPRTYPSKAKKIAQRIHDACTRAQKSTTPFPLSVSIGITSYPLHASSIEDLIGKANRSMLFAKYHPEKKTFIWDEWEIEDAGKLYQEEVLPEVIYTLAETVNMKNGYTGEHSRLVAEQATLLARKIGLEEKRIKKIKTAALLHDVGKLTIPSYILNKPASLTLKEREIIEKHAENSARIVRYIRGLNKIIPIVRAIHERWDGKGYPDGLVGEKIPLEARIISLVDAFQALISDRPYRKKFSKKKVIEELQNGSGKQFDPKLVKVFLKILGEEK